MGKTKAVVHATSHPAYSGAYALSLPLGRATAPLDVLFISRALRMAAIRRFTGALFARVGERSAGGRTWLSGFARQAASRALRRGSALFSLHEQQTAAPVAAQLRSAERCPRCRCLMLRLAAGGAAVPLGVYVALAWGRRLLLAQHHAQATNAACYVRFHLPALLAAYAALARMRNAATLFANSAAGWNRVCVPAASPPSDDSFPRRTLSSFCKLRGARHCCASCLAAALCGQRCDAALAAAAAMRQRGAWLYRMLHNLMRAKRRNAGRAEALGVSGASRRYYGHIIRVLSFRAAVPPLVLLLFGQAG